jgi:starch synthase
MRIVHLSAEFAPIAKAGGLGEVVLGLGRELTRKGFDVDIIIPKYDFIKLPDAEIEVPHFKCFNNNNTLWKARVEECQLHLLEARPYFHRGKIYGCEDDAIRFIYFTRAALEYLRLQNRPIDVLHLHDWHVSLAAPLVKQYLKDLKVKSIVLTIHNVEYQGICAPHDLATIGLKVNQDVNLLQLGIEYADAIVPVSPTYAKEILLPEYGFRLEGTLKKNSSKLKGILNGIDTKTWDPSNDPHLPIHYQPESALKAKEEIRKKFPLDPKKRPWVGAVTRLAPQKGPELLEEALRKTVALGGSFLLLGSSHIPAIQNHFDLLKAEFANHPQVYLNFAYDETIAHQIYGALDFLIVPSHFEPCGLTQLIAMRYGTIPIVRTTGGLKDTVFDCEESKIPSAQRNGLTFPTGATLPQTLERAFSLFQSNPSLIQGLIRKGMESDFSWKNPAREYLKLYRALLI